MDVRADHKTGLVSIIITAYSHPQWLSEAIESALKQTYQPIEIIVVSDGVPTKGVLMAKAQYKGVQFIQQEHAGVGAARNTGLMASKGNYIQFLDEDDLLEPRAVAEKSDILISQPEIGAVYSDIYLMSESGEVIGTHFSGWKHPWPRGDIFEHLARRNFMIMHPLWRRTVLERVGGFRLRTGTEDWECLLRAAEFDNFDYIDRPLGSYRLHQNNISHNFPHMVRENGIVQSYIISSFRFSNLNRFKQVRLLTSYAFEQWRDGDVTLGVKFYSMARQIDPLNPYCIILNLLMLIGQPLVRFGMKIVWSIRNRLRFSANYYFLHQSKHRQVK
jgi:glycosyltransferase involved in cell wall biosynthesis